MVACYVCNGLPSMLGARDRVPLAVGRKAAPHATSKVQGPNCPAVLGAPGGEDQGSYFETYTPRAKKGKPRRASQCGNGASVRRGRSREITP